MDDLNSKKILDLSKKVPDFRSKILSLPPGTYCVMIHTLQSNDTNSGPIHGIEDLDALRSSANAFQTDYPQDQYEVEIFTID